VDDHVPSSEERRGRELGFDPTTVGTALNVLGMITSITLTAREEEVGEVERENET